MTVLAQVLQSPTMVPRYLPNAALPAGTYVPGGATPRPADVVATESGAPAEQFEPASWRSCREFLWAIDLFNSGYYWEAHEVWEGLWHRAGRRGLTADFLKGLIKLAAAGVKAYEGRPEGMRRHARRAGELWAPHRASGAEPWLALEIGRLTELAAQALARAAELASGPHSAPVAGLVGAYRPGDPPPTSCG